MTAAVAMVTASPLPLLVLVLLALVATAGGRALQEEPVEVDVHVHVDGQQHDEARYHYQVDDNAAAAVADGLAPTVTMGKQGSVAGIVEQSDQRKRPIYSYLGIPFAEAPVGERRFVAPVAKAPWSGVLNATRPGNICVQTGAATLARVRRDIMEEVFAEPAGAQSEDCLVLNVHTPKVDPTAKLPVLVFVHGGSFLTGHAGSKTPYGLLDDDVILVSPQYRLGVLGFLNMQVDEVPGNAGLMDLVLALRWVHDNIEYFGGDPGRVTLGGHSAGAASSSLLYLSPLTKGLMHAVMPMSGSALGFWSWDHNPEAAAETIAGIACDTRPASRADRVQCLRSLDARELIGAYALYAMQALLNGNLGMSGTTPSVQNAPNVQKVLPMDPVNMLASKDLVPLPYLTGITKHEGTFPLKIAEGGYLEPTHLMEDTSFVRNDLLHVLLKVIGLDDPAAFAADSSVLAYLDPQTLGDYFAMRSGVIDMLGAFGFKSPARRVVQLNAARGQPSFLLAFNYNGELTANSPEGIYHGADQPYLFPQGREFTGNDLNVALTLRKLVANFVAHHNPTATAVTVAGSTVTWPQFQRDSEHYLDLSWPPADRQWTGAELTVARREHFGDSSSSTAGASYTTRPAAPTTGGAAASTSATTGSTRAHNKDDNGNAATAAAPSSLALAVLLLLSLLCFRREI